MFLAHHFIPSLVSALHVVDARWYPGSNWTTLQWVGIWLEGENMDSGGTDITFKALGWEKEQNKVIAGFRAGSERAVFCCYCLQECCYVRKQKQQRETDNTAKKWDDWGTNEGSGRIRYVSFSRAFHTLMSIWEPRSSLSADSETVCF